MAKKKKVIMGRPVKYPGVWKKFPMYFRTAAEINTFEHFELMADDLPGCNGVCDLINEAMAAYEKKWK